MPEAVVGAEGEVEVDQEEAGVDHPDGSFVILSNGLIL